jgi:hypothetical protein
MMTLPLLASHCIASREYAVQASTAVRLCLGTICPAGIKEVRGYGQYRSSLRDPR